MVGKFQSQAERKDRGQGRRKVGWLLFEGIDTFLYDLTRKSKSSQSGEIAARRRKAGGCLKGLTRFCTTHAYH